MTDKEKALKGIVNLIKATDSKAIEFDVLNSQMEIASARANLFNIIAKHGFELTKDYKLIPKK